MDEEETKYHKDMSEMTDKLENMSKSVNPEDRKQLVKLFKQLEEFVQCVMEIRKRMEERHSRELKL